jgi:uncharacterized membrane protein
MVRRFPFSASSFILPALILLALVLRAHDVTRHSLWSDEIYTLEASAGHGLENKWYNDAGLVDPMPDLLSLNNAEPWPAVATSLARDDNHPPLYFYLMRAWRCVFGDSDSAIRWLSVLFSVAAIAFLYDAVKHLHGELPACWAALLMTVAGPQIQFAHEARAYALLVLLGACCCSAIARIEVLGLNRMRLVALGASALGMMLTHYYGIGPLIGLAVYSAIRLRGTVRRRVFLCFLVSAGMFLLLWGWGLWRQRLNIAGNNSYILEQAPDHLFKTFRRVALLPIEFLFEPTRNSDIPAAFSAVLYVIPFLLVRRHPRALLWGLWLCCSVGLVLAVDVISSSRQLEFLRYTIAGSPAVYAILVSIDWPRRWLGQAIPACAVVGCLISLPLAYSQTQNPKPDWRVIAQLVKAHSEPGDIVFCYGRELAGQGIVANYLCLSHYFPDLPRTVIFTQHQPDAAMLQRMREAPSVWLMIEPNTGFNPHWLRGLKPTGVHTFILRLPFIEQWAPVKTAMSGD